MIFAFRVLSTAGILAAEFIEQHWILLSFFLALLGYRQTKAMNENNNAPAVIPLDLDVEKFVVKLHNHGRGIAQNVQLYGYNHLMDWEELGDGKLDRWKLAFPPIGFLPQNESVPVPIIDDEGRMVFSLLFSRFKMSLKNASDNQKRPVPLFISYQNLNGKYYYTSINVVPGAFTFAKFGENYWSKRMLQILREYVKSKLVGPIYLINKRRRLSAKNRKDSHQNR